MLEKRIVAMAYFVGIRDSSPNPGLICRRESSMADLCCMSFLGKDSSEILVAGCQNIMYKIDVEKGIVLQEVGLRRLLKFAQLI